MDSALVGEVRADTDSQDGWVVHPVGHGYDGGPGCDGLVHPDEETARIAAQRLEGDHWTARYNPPTAFTDAAQRVSFQLTYARSPQKRVFHRGGLTGPRIPCAFNPDGIASGEWEEPEAWMRACDDDDRVLPDTTTVDEWHRRFFTVAVAEAVHEACEWFTVDGRAVTDPHSAKMGNVCYDAAVDAAATIWAHAHHRRAPDPSVVLHDLPDDGLDGIRRRLDAAERQTRGARTVVEVDRSGIGHKKTRIITDDAEHGSVMAEIIWDEGYADFVAHAPEDIALLLAEVDELRARLAGR